QQEERMRFPLPWPEEEWVFTNQMGGPLDHRSDSRQWRTLLRDAGVRQVRLHDARHTAATMLLVQGVSARVAQEMLGWSESRMASRYQHVIPELQRDAAARIGGVLGAENA